jgi:hypothetical protein
MGLLLQIIFLIMLLILAKLNLIAVEAAADQAKELIKSANTLADLSTAQSILTVSASQITEIAAAN